MGVPAKVARVNMDGSDSRVLYELPSNRHPEAITINAESLEIYFSTSNRATVGIFVVQTTTLGSMIGINLNKTFKLNESFFIWFKIICVLSIYILCNISFIIFSISVFLIF